MPSEPEEVLAAYLDQAEFTARRAVEDAEIVERFHRSLTELLDEDSDMAVALAHRLLGSDDAVVREQAAISVLHLVAERRPADTVHLYKTAFADPENRVRNTAYREFLRMLKDSDVNLRECLPILEVAREFRDEIDLPDHDLTVPDEY